MEDAHVKDLKGKLEALPPISSECCIYSIPKRLRDVKEKVYTPQVVSLGPLHHAGNKSLEAMEEHKMQYVKDFLERTKVSLESCFKSIKEMESRIRACYSVTLEYKEDELVEMMLVDGIFTLEVLMRSTFTELRKENDRIFGKPWMHRDIIYDMLMLENQIPFFVLEYFFFLAHANNAIPIESGLSLIKLTHTFFQDRVYLRPFEEIFNHGTSKIQHFVDFVLKCHLPPPSAIPHKKKAQHSSHP